MPFTKITVRKGHLVEFLKQIMDLVHESMVETLEIPADDRNQVLNEIEPDFFYTKPPYAFFIEISLFSGRTKETKSKLYQSIVNKLLEYLSIDPKSIFIIINEQPRENWGIRGGISAADIQFDFKINR